MLLPTSSTDRNNLLSYSLYVAVFLSGFVTMSLEMLIGRTLIPYFGGTIYTWGALISVFLSGMALGYTVGGIAADKKPDIRLIGFLFILAALSIVVVPLFGDVVINSILDRVEDVRYAALLTSLFLACLPAALLAAVSPYCVRLLLDRRDHSGTISGRISGLSTAGCILGTLSTSFFFIPTLGVKMIYGLLGGVSVVMSSIFFIFNLRSHAPEKTRMQMLPILFFFVAALAGIFTPHMGYAQPASMATLKDGLIEKIDSEYNTIFIEKQKSYLSMLFGYRANRYTESVIDFQNPNDLVVTYTRYMTSALAYRHDPVKRIALVGLGGGRTINYLISNLKGVVADVAELDPAVIALAKKYFGVEETNQLHIHNKDGRVYLSQTKDTFDLILLDAYRGPFVPFHLTTEEFYRIVKSRLNEGGIVAQNVDPSTLFFDSAYVTMKGAFDQVDAIEANGNIVLIGYAGPRLSTTELAKRSSVAQEMYRLKYDLRELITARKNVDVSSSAKVLTDDFAPVEMLKTVKHHNEKQQ